VHAKRIWLDTVYCSLLPIFFSLTKADDRAKWRKFVFDAANHLIEDGKKKRTEPYQ